MMTNKKQKNTKQVETISFDLLTSKINKLANSLSVTIEEIIQTEKTKVKIVTSRKQVSQFAAEIQEIQNTYKQHLNKAPLTLDAYCKKVNTRANDLNEMLYKIENYSVKSITNQLKKEAEEQGIEHTKIKTFINELTNSIVNLVLEYNMKFEEFIVELLCEKEMKRINVDYYANNSALQHINIQKYENYIKLIYKGINAFYHDFKAFTNQNTLFFQIIEKFFIKLLQKIEQLQCTNATENNKVEEQSLDFPTHIFKSQSAYNTFEELAKQATNQETIGFYFRQMSEKENPKLIVATETVFRTWFNEESEHTIELKNPIKTFDRIKGLINKRKVYDLVMEKNSVKTTKK
jgi:hypothetical protein